MITDKLAAVAQRGTRGGVREGAGRRRVVEDPVRLTVDYERGDFEQLSRMADAKGRSVASLVREAVSEYLARRRGR